MRLFCIQQVLEVSMKRIVIVSCLLLVVLACFAQDENQWIKFNQIYYKIPVAKDGLYKLTYNNLQQSGFPVTAIDPRSLQLFHRGVEQAIYVEGQEDTKFDATDYIEFYGRKNDGTLDTELYSSPGDTTQLHPHSYYNLYSDTTSYFLTMNSLVLGKRMVPFYENKLTNIIENYHVDEKLLVLTDIYNTGLTYSNYLQTSFFDSAEGWGGIEIRQTQSLDYVVSGVTSRNDLIGLLPQLEVLFLGRGEMLHVVDIMVGPNTGALRTLTSAQFLGYRTSLVTIALNWNDIGLDGKLVVRIKVIGAGGSDRISTGYVKLSYPQVYNAAAATEKVFKLRANPSNKSYIEIQNPVAGLRLFDITDPANVMTIGAKLETTLNAVIPNTNVARSIYATNTSLIPASVKSVTFRQIDPVAYNYVIISNRLLMKAALGYSNPIKAFAEYRASAAGGNYDTLVVEVSQLFDQFNYGEKSPLAIFHFMKFLCATHTPDYLFIIGKGLTLDYRYYRNPANGALNEYKDLVPAAGIPPSDMYYTVGLSGTTHEPAVPTGRIPATKPADVAAYLNKVKEMESLPFNALWRKNILHLSGGINPGEPETFRAYMEDFQEIAEGPFLGGKVKAIPKRTTNIELINISEEVNKGLNLVTFYGHSSPSTIDFDIGFVRDPVLGYNNVGKYPTLLMNGCNAGAFFYPGVIFGEDWINQPNKGAIGFIAHSSYGLSSLLKLYTDVFYSVGYGDSLFIKRGLGDIQKQVAKVFINSFGDNAIHVAQVQQMILLGDPAVKLFGAPKPDYEVNENNVFTESFNGAPITALTDSFKLNMIVRNFGQAREDTLLVRVERTFNDGSKATYHRLFPPILYSDTLSFTIHNDNTSSFGNNSFAIKIDADDELSEMDESNNTISKSLLIPLNGTKNLFPYDYAIVKDVQVSLVFQSTNLLSGKRDFFVEIDTVDSFSSPFKQQFIASGTVLVKQPVIIFARDTLAYYWRTKLKDPLSGESTSWTINSFTYIEGGEEGWAQVDFPQYLKNQSVGLVKDATSLEFKFEETETNISITTFGSSNPASNENVSVKLNNAEYNLSIQGDGCRTNTINLIAFDKTSTVPYAGVPLRLSNPRSCGREPNVINNFQVEELELANENILLWVDNVIVGDSVVLFSIGNAGFNSWSATVKNKLGDVGISVAQINALTDGEPVVIFGKKGSAAGSAKIFRTSGIPANSQELLIDKTITGRYTSGKMNSVVVGPAQSWTSFIKKIDTKENSDAVSFDIIGIKLNGAEVLIEGNVTTDIDLTTINAQDFPFLKISYSAVDEVNLTPVQLRKWLVIYEPMAEGILVYKGTDEQQVKKEGEVWSGRYSFVNISDKNFVAPLTVHLEVFNSTNRISAQNEDFEIIAPEPGDTTNFNITINTKEKSGLNDISVFVNPHLLPEQYYENNVIELPSYLNVLGDVYNPVLDVTVDGLYLVNGDSVSANPHIVVEVWDENDIALKTDTTGVNIFLKYLCKDCEFQRINFTNADIKYYPATATTNFRVELSPHGLPEGIYTLRVEAKDVHGNISGEDPYEVTFKVTNSSFLNVSISDPYPNPSTDAFTFTMVLKGSDLPEEFTVQIISVNGKLLQEVNFDKESFHLGINKLSWDGVDSAGNIYSNGIYVYRIVLKASGKEVRKIGKLALIK